VRIPCCISFSGPQAGLLLKPVTYCDFTLDPDPLKQKLSVGQHLDKALEAD